MRHDNQQSDRFHRDRFAAGVRTADEQSAVRFIQLQRDRNYRFALPPQHVFEKRMPGFLQNQPAGGIRAEAWNGAAEIKREFSLGEQ